MIVNHRVKNSRNQKYVEYGEQLYRIPWYGFKPSYDTLEPTEQYINNEHIGRRQVQEITDTG